MAHYAKSKSNMINNDTKQVKEAKADLREARTSEYVMLK